MPIPALKAKKQATTRLLEACLVLAMILSSGQVARADNIYAGCDYVNDTEAFGGVGGAFGCGDESAVTLDQNRTLYGIEGNVRTLPTGNMYYRDTQQNISCTYYNASTTLGYYTFVFPTPIPFLTSETMVVQFYSDSSCTQSSQMTTYYTNNTQFTHKIWYWSDEFEYFDITTTRINSVEPFGGTTISSTTPLILGATGWVNEPDVIAYNDDPFYVDIKWSFVRFGSSCMSVICAFDSAGGGALRTVRLGQPYFLTAGSDYGQAFSEATTTNIFLPDGKYTMTTSLVRPTSILGITSLFGIGFGEATLTQRQSEFIVGTSTSLDDILAGLKDFQFTATTTAQALASCNPLSFGLVDCLNVLFVPSVQDMTSLWDYVRDSLFSRAPWGYGTRLITILTNNASSTMSTDLPTFTVQFPIGSPLYDSPITFNMQEILMTGSTTIATLVDPITGKTMREIVEPFILLFIAISALIIVFHDLMGMGRHKNNYDNN